MRRSRLRVQRAARHQDQVQVQEEEEEQHRREAEEGRLEPAKAREDLKWKKAHGLHPSVEGDPPVPPLSLPDETTPILITMASFLDGVRCARTVNWALEKAKHPDRLSFTVLQAHTAGKDPDCKTTFQEKHLPKLCDRKTGTFRHLFKKKHKNKDDCEATVLGKLTVWSIDPEEGKGPAHQRGLANELFELNDRDDKFCLNIDAHMDFRKSWDETMVQDWVSTGNEFAVLSTYPLAMYDEEKGEKFEDTRIDLCGFSLENGIPRGKTGATLFNPPGVDVDPYLSMNWAAGQSFQRCHADRNVPVDPNLKWIFTGEEVNRAVRFWTHGYDLYLPSTTAILHDYGHPVQTFWSYRGKGKVDAEEKEEMSSRDRLLTLLHLGTGAAVEGDETTKQVALGEYGIGNQRSLEDYMAWSKEDWGGPWTKFLQNHGGAVDPGVDFCKKLTRMPVKDKEALIASARSKGKPALSQAEALAAGAHREN